MNDGLYLDLGFQCFTSVSCQSVVWFRTCTTKRKNLRSLETVLIIKVFYKENKYSSVEILFWSFCFHVHLDKDKMEKQNV